MTAWVRSWRTDPRARVLADRHYNRQKIGAAGFVPPGRCVVLRTREANAVWATSWPFAEFVRHAWAGAWINSLFRNESEYLSSDLIRDAVAVTLGVWGDPPELGMVTFVDAGKTRQKRDPGRCYRKAGFIPAACPLHAGIDLILPTCAACQSETRGGLVALQLLPVDMPAPIALSESRQLTLWEAAS